MEDAPLCEDAPLWEARLSEGRAPVCGAPCRIRAPVEGAPLWDTRPCEGRDAVSEARPCGSRAPVGAHNREILLRCGRDGSEEGRLPDLS